MPQVRLIGADGEQVGVIETAQALALADGIGNSGLWLVEGLGHEVPDGLVPALLERIREHLAGGC